MDKDTMRKQGNNETFQSGSRIPRASLSTSMHKPSLSESIKAPSKLSSSKLNINLSLLHPSRNKIPPSSASTTKRNLLLTNRKEEDSMIMKQSLNTVKSTLKKFDLRSKTLNSSLLSHSRFRWEEMKTPASLSEVLSNFAEVIPQWEQEEIKGYCEIYYIGKSFKPKDPEFDDEHGDYKIKIKDHIGFRYEIIGMIGKGSFGQVIEVFDHCEKKTMALKIIKNKERFNQQAKVEVEVLEFIKLHDVQKTSNIIEIQDKFIFRNHMCILFDLYSLNLYELLKKNSFKGLSMSLIKKIGLQLFNSLKSLEECQIIHCDLKPENILLMHQTRSNIKLIDLGSSCYMHKRIYTYIQSRFYRAPEIILGIPYTPAIDTWSLGCIFVELYTGIPLFPGENETDQLQCMMEVLGVPSVDLIGSGKRRDLFFNSNREPKIVPNSRGRRRVPGTRVLRNLLKGADEEFCQIVEACLKWDPLERIKPVDAINLQWFQEADIERQRGLVYQHKKISIEDITKHVPNLQKYMAHRNTLSIT